MNKITFKSAKPRSELIAAFGYGAELTEGTMDLEAEAKPCPTCDGAGKIREGNVECPDCNGTGKVPSEPAVTASAVTEALREQGLSFTQIVQALAPQLGQPPAPEPKADAPEKPAEDPDTAVEADLHAIKDAVDKAIAAQEADENGPADAKVLAGLKEISKTLDDVAADQEADDKEDDKSPVLTAAGNGVGVEPKDGEAPANPESGKGDVENGVICANPDCGHMASAHANEEGKNMGPCAMKGCACPAMETSSSASETGEAGQPIGVETGEGADEANAVKLALPGEPPVPGAAPAESTDGSDMNAPPETPGGVNMGPAFTIPVAIIEGQPTGDGRQIAPGALTWRTPPLPLMGLATETHDPEGMDMNDPAVICGRIDSFTREAGEGSTQIIVAKGFYLADVNGTYFANLTESMGRCGISADVAVEASEITGVDIDEMGFPVAMDEILTEGTIMALTQVPMPAFEGAYIVLGDGAEKPDAIPQAAETTPVAASAHFMTYAECEPCQQGFEVITAAGGPTRPPAAWFANPNFTEGDGRLMEILDKRGKRVLGGKFACPITVSEDGRVFGHLAPWDVCHSAFPGKCVLAPRSRVNYAHFKRGAHVLTAEGESIPVGVITADLEHSSTRKGTPGFSASEAMSHYDNTALAVADVNIGEDEYGIWVAGAIRPEATEDQVRNLRASALSGDWRALGGQLELVAALAVNVPGYPLAVVAHGEQEALVAAGAGVMYRLSNPAPEPPKGDVALRKAVGPLLDEARSRARERVAALK